MSKKKFSFGTSKSKFRKFEDKSAETSAEITVDSTTTTLAVVDKKTEKVYVNEVNTLPGFTKYSMFPSLWADEGVEFTELIEKIVEYGYERYRVKDNRKTVYWD